MAIGLTRAFAAAIENAPRADSDVFAAIAAGVAVTACAAMLAPARRAMSIGIVQALRRE